MSKFIKGIWIFITDKIQNGKIGFREARDIHEAAIGKVLALYCQQY
jgi:hypothetical protein